MTILLAPAHARALALTAPVVAAIRPEQLALPTPCVDWTLRRLLEHVIGQQYGFAAAARGQGADLAVWADRPVATGQAGTLAALAAFADSARELTEAFAAAEAAAATLQLPEILAGHAFPAGQAIGFHLLDTLVHAWDLAAAVGLPLEVPADLAGLLLGIAEQVPADSHARRPGRAFAPVVPAPEGADAFERALRLLGRDPRWQPAG
ncbi:TIGR03086 family metal-binding protein [Kitasatospora sp. NBC_01287]|uniref:TIGR03086 family metal-binding protein n=1 Tax=Kitasatospora sp. NBC_01287 TaxID=2903573 RepID=UPI00225164C1|nr:TIGR03086 family metal-binding protein [Kitasatospora sp. NBC_01287]MCX4747521.1 TIGR03086 family metal-binding protein [Kitasatospora sp. NBC_01287]